MILYLKNIFSIFRFRIKDGLFDSFLDQFD